MITDLIARPSALLATVATRLTGSKHFQPSTHVPPSEALRPSDHFSSLLFSSVRNSAIEFCLLLSLSAVAFGGVVPWDVNVSGSMSLAEVSCLMWTASVFRKLYNSYLEAVYFSCPRYRTQPPREHALAKDKDLSGRDRAQLKMIEKHDLLTLFSQFALDLAIYYMIPGFYPAAKSDPQGWATRVCKLALNHYVLSFGMYWMHRYMHLNGFLWEKIHSFHHWAKHPLSRNTYEDHWLDNLLNTLVGHVAAQLIVPLDNTMFWASRLIRIAESLEKHSGVSCHWNLAHTMQSWLPYAQMPHHHDWHHEGHKSCNFTFASVGGVWDCVFGTRKMGRADREAASCATAEDKKAIAAKHER